MKKLLGLLFISLPLCAFTTEGMVRGSLTFSAGTLHKANLNPYYLHGDLEYFPIASVSIRSDGDLYLGNLNNSSEIKKNHQGFLGLAFHLPLTAWLIPYVGFQPGWAISQWQKGSALSETRMVPLASAVLGVNYFAENYFHFFFNVRHVYGELISTGTGAISLQETRFAFGLGGNLTFSKSSGQGGSHAESTSP